MSDSRPSPPPLEITVYVHQSFLIFSPQEFLEPLRKLCEVQDSFSTLVQLATDGLESVISAASLPFILTQNAVVQRKFDRFHAAARIRSMIPKIGKHDSGTPDEEVAYKKASEDMRSFSDSEEGSFFFRDEIIYQLNRSLGSDDIRNAAQELLVQTLVGTWSVFENFARAFVIDWINSNPKSAQVVMKLPELRDYFGKQAVDIQIIGEHGFDLSRSMGSVIFKGRRLDSLSVVRALLKALFNSSELQTTLDDDLWLLNQRRHLFVHHRGLIDQEFKNATGDSTPVGTKLVIYCRDVERSLLTVRSAILEIISQARKPRVEELQQP